MKILNDNPAYIYIECPLSPTDIARFSKINGVTEVRAIGDGEYAVDVKDGARRRVIMREMYRVLGEHKKDIANG